MKYSRCPIRHVLSQFSDKWSLLVLCHLYTGGTMRFGELASAMTDISERMLIERRYYKELPPRVEYSLTELGKSAMPRIEALFNWAKEHFDEITSPSR